MRVGFYSWQCNESGSPRYGEIDPPQKRDLQWYSTGEAWSKLAQSSKLEQSQTNYGPGSLESCLKSKLLLALVGTAQEKDEWG